MLSRNDGEICLLGFYLRIQYFRFVLLTDIEKLTVVFRSLRGNSRKFFSHCNGLLCSKGLIVEQTHRILNS